MANNAITNKKIASQKLDAIPLQTKKEKIYLVKLFTWQTAAGIHDAKYSAWILRSQVLGINDTTHIVKAVTKKAHNQ